jgi:PAS domain S-box-containing protein
MAQDAVVGAGGIPLPTDILRRLLESSQDVLYAVALCPVRMLYATPAFAQRMGLPEDFLNRPFEFAEYLSYVHPDDYLEVAGTMRAIVASRSDADLPENPACYRLRTPNGGWRVIQDFYSVLRDPDGVPHTLIGNARDVSEQSEARRVLKEREARFRFLAENSRDIFFSLRFPEVRYEYISPSVKRIFGVTPQDFYADAGTLLRCIAPAWRETVQGWMAEIAQGRVPDEYEFQVVDKNGGLRWLCQRQVLVPAPDGEHMLLQGVATDQTEEHEAREALRASEEHFRNLIEAWPDQVMLSVNLTTSRHEYVSPSMERVLGYAPQEFYDDPGLGMRVVAPQWRDTAREWVEELRRGIVRPAYEFQLVHKNGEHRWVQQVGVIRPHAPGQDQVVQFTFRDVTEEHEAREALRASEERYRELAEGWQDQAVVRINLHTNRYEYVSPGMQKVFGFPPEEFTRDVRGTVGRTVAPEWRETVQEWMAEARSGKLRPEYEFELIDAWGGRRWGHLRCTLMHAADGSPAVVQGVLFDNTQHKRLEAELAASEAKYRTLHESMRDGFVIVDMDGVYVEHNNAFRDMLGYTDEEIARLTYHDITPERWHDAEARILAEQVFVRGYSDVYEKEYRGKDGTVFPVSLRSYLEAEVPGRPQRLWAVVRDISDQKRAEDALRKNEALLEAMLRNLPFDFWARDLRQRIIMQSEESLRLWGDLRQGAVRQPLFDDQTMELWRSTNRRVLAGEMISEERTCTGKNGERRDVHNILAPIRDGAEVLGLIGISIDITKQKQAAEALRESEERFRLIVETASEGIWAVDAEQRATFVNAAMARMLGYTVEEMLGVRTMEFLFPEDLEPHVRRMELRRAGQEEIYERRFLRKNGTVLWTLASAKPLRDYSGRFGGAFAMFVDITERKAAEEALRTSEARYALALQGANDGIWDWDLVEDKVYYSDRWKEILGYEPDELRHDAEEWVSRIHPEDLSRVMAANESCSRGEVPIFQVEYRLRHKDGSYRWIFGRGTALADGTGRVVRMAGAHTDITGRKEAEEALLRSERLSRKLLESMHEGVWAVDANRRTTFVNERLCTMLGYATAELMNMTPVDVLEWPQCHVAESRFPDLEAGHAGATDYVLVRKDGTRFPAHVVSSPIMEKQGSFEGLVCGVVDLTERARMEHELRRNQARFEALFELSRLNPATEHQLAAFTLHEAIRLTESSAGLLFFVSEDGQSLVPRAWETCGFMVDRQVPSFPASGPLPWVTVLQSGLPLLINDFSECAHHIPPGHPAVTRFLGVPALEGQRPVSVLALMGKEVPYVPEDTLQITLLLDGMWREVRTRRDAERIRESLREKEALLHEVHHRVKNNLQVISSLMDMAGRRLGSPEARLSLAELRGKVQAMSLIHAQLQGANSGGGISLERFVRALFHHLREVYSGNLSLTLLVELSTLALALDQAVPLGLALNEALTNVFKHACPDGRAGQVFIRAGHTPEGMVCILVRDDGPGLPEGLEPTQAQSLGMKLMHGLITHQLNGKLEILNSPPPDSPGVEVCICFPPNIAK